MTVTNSHAMRVLLSALMITEYTINEGFIEINLNQQQLLYCINAYFYGEVEAVYGQTEEWRELSQYLKGMV